MFARSVVHLTTDTLSSYTVKQGFRRRNLLTFCLELILMRQLISLATS
jgi:hypothetical protein